MALLLFLIYETNNRKVPSLVLAEPQGKGKKIGYSKSTRAVKQPDYSIDKLKFSIQKVEHKIRLYPLGFDLQGQNQMYWSR